MNGAAIITNALLHWLDIGSGITSANATFRARTLLHLNQTVQKFDRLHPWPHRFGMSTESSVVGPPAYVELPLDFGSFGQNGIVVDPSTYRTLRYLDLRRIQEMILGIGSTGNPLFYSLGTVAGPPSEAVLYVYPLPAVVYSLEMTYERKAETVTDAAAELEIPGEYEDIITDGVVARLMMDEGDNRAGAFEHRFTVGVAEAWADQIQGRNTYRRMPRYGRGRRM